MEWHSNFKLSVTCDQFTLQQKACRNVGDVSLILCEWGICRPHSLEGSLDLENAKKFL